MWDTTERKEKKGGGRWGTRGEEDRCPNMRITRDSSIRIAGQTGNLDTEDFQNVRQKDQMQAHIYIR